MACDSMAESLMGLLEFRLLKSPDAQPRLVPPVDKTSGPGKERRPVSPSLEHPEARNTLSQYCCTGWPETC